MSSGPERWVVWNDGPHHYCHEDSLFVNLTMDLPPPDLTKPVVVFGKGDVAIPIQNHPTNTSLHVKEVFYYKAAEARNYLNLKILQEDYPKLGLGKMKIDEFHGTGIVHSDDPDRILLEVDEFDEER